MALRKFLACTIAAAALVTAAACADGTGKALTPTLPTTSSTAANPDGTLLKATSPQPRSPISGVRVSSLSPELRVANASGENASVALTYHFQILEGSTVVAESAAVAAGSSETAWTAPADVLKHDVMYAWRARASFGGVPGSWSADLVTFRTPLPPPPPGSAGAVVISCPGNSGPEIIECVKAAYPERLVKTSDGDFSDERRKENMAFLRDRIIEIGRCKGLDLGRNYKRGTPVISYDFIVWRRPGHRSAGVDIARGYDATRERLQLGWMVWGAPSYGHPYYAGYNDPFTCP